MPNGMVRPCYLLCLLLGACSGDSTNERSAAVTAQLVPKPAETSVDAPTILRVAVRIDGGIITVLSVTPKRGNAFDPGGEVVRHRALEGSVRLLRFEALDASGAVVGVGTVPVPLVAVAEYLDRDVPHRIVRAEQPLASTVVTIAVPYSPQLKQLRFFELTPSPEAPVERWRSAPLSTVELRPGTTEPSQGRQP